MKQLDPRSPQAVWPWMLTGVFSNTHSLLPSLVVFFPGLLIISPIFLVLPFLPERWPSPLFPPWVSKIHRTLFVLVSSILSWRGVQLLVMCATSYFRAHGSLFWTLAPSARARQMVLYILFDAEEVWCLPSFRPIHQSGSLTVDLSVMFWESLFKL